MGRQGITFIEFIVVIAAVLLVMAAVLPRTLTSPAYGGNIQADSQDIVNVLLTAQSNAASSKLNDHWGIKLVDDGTTNCGTTATADCVVMYKGTAFASRDTQYDRVFVLRDKNYFSVLPDTDFYFNKGSGFAQGLLYSVTTTIAITDGLSTSTVAVYSDGSVRLIKNWYDARWPYRKKISLNNAKVYSEESGFVIVATTTDTDLKTRAQSDGDDILFTSLNGTKLSHEIESYTSGTGALVAWVKTDVASSTDTVLYMYYGNGDASSQQSVSDVWTNYLAVWHMNETASSTNSIADSSGNGYHGTPRSPVSATGYIANGLDFVRTASDADDLVDTGVNVPVHGQNLTFSAWAKADALYTTTSLMSKWHGANGWKSYAWDVGSTGRIQFWTDDGSTSGRQDTAGSTFTTGGWRHVAAVWDATATNVVHYYNGAFKANNVDTNPPSITNQSNFSNYLGNTFSNRANAWDGILDEMRIYKGLKTEQWIHTEYDNQRAAGEFYTISSQEHFLD